MRNYMKYVTLVLVTFLFACTVPAGTNSNGPTPNPSAGSQVGNGQSGSAGDAGQNGSDGPTGASGKDGLNGIDNKIIHSWSCNFTTPASVVSASGQTAPFIGHINFWFHASETTAGDTFARGGLDAVNNASRTTGSVSSTEFWPSNSAQAKQAFTWALIWCLAQMHLQ
jgi:hypothetical protein